ncbi:RagB/SusD family nutrient uptake outer membrane protein [Flagellimonas sp.]|uniref:RagB/SusD family nutrient uptake outer membrane protein n=1 Tax=Flagellimonas sp. TaxID=2058762 RepID=UPI003BAE15FC
MKRIIYTILAITALTFHSCDIERNPYDQIAVDDLFSDPGSIETATIGNYALLKGDVGYDGWVDDLHRISEYAGDNITLSGGTTDHLFFLYNYQSIATNSRVDRFWRNSYKIVVGTNLMIEKIEEGESTEGDQLLGENYYLRGLVFFQMGNVFGRPFNQGGSNPSIPLKLTSDTEDRPDRHTVQEVYDQVISDLLKAESLMTENKGASFASKEAAQALLSRVYLYMGDNSKAQEFADKVINSGVYSLLPTSEFSQMNRLTPDQNSEAIFAVTLSSASDLLGQWDDWFTIGSFYASIEGTGWGEMYASRSYLDLIDQNDGDARRSFIDPQYLTDDNGDRIPAVYWVDESYVYQFAQTTDSGGTITFDYDGNNYTLQSEVVDGKTVYFFNGPNGRQDVIFDFDMEKRNGHPKFFILKASLQEDDLHMWSPTVSRLAEMYLNKAESLAKGGADQAALDNINVLRQRAGVPEYTLANLPAGKTVLDVVLDERRLELAFEGHRRYDVYRNEQTMNRRYPGTHLNNSNPFFEIPPSHPRVVEFIPEQQIILQPSLEQNPQ